MSRTWRKIISTMIFFLSVCLDSDTHDILGIKSRSAKIFVFLMRRMRFLALEILVQNAENIIF